MAAHTLTAEAGRHHRHADVVAQLVVVGGAVDHVRIRRRISPDSVHRQLRFAQFQRTLGRRDQHQHTLGARKVNAFEQRTSHRLLGRDARAVRPISLGRAHHGFAGLTHHRAHVFKVDVDMTGHIDDFGNAADRVFQHVVGVRKGFVLGDVVAQHFKQLFIEHHDQRIDIRFQLGQTQIGIGHAAAAFKVERLGDHPDRQNAHLLGHACNHGRRACSRATTHTRCDEEHVRAGNGAANVINREFSCITAFVGLAASAESAVAELNGFVRATPAERLRVRIRADELDTLHAAIDHVPDRIAATTTDTNHLDLRALVEFFNLNHFDAHWEPPIKLVAVAKTQEFFCSWKLS